MSDGSLPISEATQMPGRSLFSASVTVDRIALGSRRAWARRSVTSSTMWSPAERHTRGHVGVHTPAARVVDDDRRGQPVKCQICGQEWRHYPAERESFHELAHA